MADVHRRIRNRNSQFAISGASSLVEIMVVISLLSLIVIALMAVFSSTQRAFRASVTQNDVLEGGRSAMDLITQDLRGMTTSGGDSNVVVGPPLTYPNDPVNFTIEANASTIYTPLIQSLPGSASLRTNVLNYFFILSRQNTKWIGIGYIVDAYSSEPLYPLYRFYAETNISSSPYWLYYAFSNTGYTNMSHLADGVIHLNVRAFDQRGRWIQGYYFPGYTNALNTYYLSFNYGEQQFYMFCNTVPAAVDLEMGILEDRSLARAESLSVAGQPPYNVPRQWGYLTNQSGSVHVFRQRVNIPNFDSSAYQP